MDISPASAVQSVLATSKVQQVNAAQMAVLSKALELEATTAQGMLATLPQPQQPQLATQGTVGTRLHAIA